MGFFDRLKKMLGGGEEEPAVAPSEQEERPSPRSKRKGQRPPLNAPPPPSETIEDVLEARAAGDKVRARKILATIDRGQGLRTVLRAAAALEAKDEAEVHELEAKVLGDAPWRLYLQTAAALGDDRGARFVEGASKLGAPTWAIAWAKAAIGDEEQRRHALVDLLFEDPALARTVAARDLKIAGVREDTSAIERFASLDAGRDAIERFGADLIVALLARIEKN